MGNSQCGGLCGGEPSRNGEIRSEWNVNSDKGSKGYIEYTPEKVKDSTFGNDGIWRLYE